MWPFSSVVLLRWKNREDYILYQYCTYQSNSFLNFKRWRKTFFLYQKLNTLSNKMNLCLIQYVQRYRPLLVLEWSLINLSSWHQTLDIEFIVCNWHCGVILLTSWLFSTYTTFHLMLQLLAVQEMTLSHSVRNTSLLHWPAHRVLKYVIFI